MLRLLIFLDFWIDVWIKQNPGIPRIDQQFFLHQLVKIFGVFFWAQLLPAYFLQIRICANGFFNIVYLVYLLQHLKNYFTYSIFHILLFGPGVFLISPIFLCNHKVLIDKILYGNFCKDGHTRWKISFRKNCEELLQALSRHLI